ncbi:MAG: DUF4337 domain-containing protein [Rhodospirillales bacterium]|nr:DUF4337 domain-containing protein [Rhodospirillales bacterium]
METDEIAEKIAELGEAEEHHRAEDVAKRRTALFISFLAMVLAICSLGGNNATKEMIGSSISASDTWNFYQAKSIRQTTYKLASEQLLLEASNPTYNDQFRQQIQGRADQYRATVERYETEPQTGEGKKELMAKAKHFEHERDIAIARDPYFDYAEACIQIAVVLASASIVANFLPLLWFSYGLGILGTLLALNGFTLAVKIPFL